MLICMKKVFLFTIIIFILTRQLSLKVLFFEGAQEVQYYMYTLSFVRDQLSCCRKLQLCYYKYLYVNLYIFNWLTVTGKSNLDTLNVVSVILCVCVCFCEVPIGIYFFKLRLVLSDPLTILLLL